ISQEREVSIQPSFRLKKREEDQPRSVEQGELTSLIGSDDSSERVGEARDHCLHRPKEPLRDAVAAQHVEPARGSKQIGFGSNCRQGAECFRVALDQAVAVADERYHMWMRARRRPADDCQVGRASSSRYEEPKKLRRISGELCSDCRQGLTDVRATVQLDGEATQGTFAFSDARGPDVSWKSKRLPGFFVEGKRWREKSQLDKDCRESVQRGRTP